MKTEGLEFEAVSDLKEYGFNDDGTPFIGEVFYVVATNARGDRWAHNMRFQGVKLEHYDEGTAFTDTRAIARFQCNRIINKIKARGYINLANWVESRPVYGSEAYVAYGQCNDWAQEQGLGC